MFKKCMCYFNIANRSRKKKIGFQDFLTFFQTIGKRDQHWVSKGSSKGNYERSRLSPPKRGYGAKGL